MQNKVNFLKSKVMYVFMTLCVSVLCAVCMGSVAKATAVVSDVQEGTITVYKDWKTSEPGENTFFKFKVVSSDHVENEYTVTNASSGLTITGAPSGITANVIEGTTPDGIAKRWVITLKGYPRWTTDSGTLITYTITETGVGSDPNDGKSWHQEGNTASGISQDNTYVLQYVSNSVTGNILTISRSMDTAVDGGLYKAKYSVEINDNDVSFADGTSGTKAITGTETIVFNVNNNDTFSAVCDVKETGEFLVSFTDLPEGTFHGVAITGYQVVKED